MKAARALAPSIGMELYTEARMPPTDRCPFNWICTCTNEPFTSSLETSAPVACVNQFQCCNRLMLQPSANA